VLILISSVAVWKNTEPKLEEIRPDVPVKEGEGDAANDEHKDNAGDKKPEAEGDKEGEGEAHAEGEGEPAHDDVPPEEPPHVEYRNVPYTEAEYVMRTPPEEYEKIKEIEDRILELHKPGLKTYVIGSGIIYGNGETETVFNDKFKSAWLQSPEYLTYVEDGENKIPTVHVVDLVRLVKKIYEAKPDKKYLFCIDNTDDRRQKALIQAISSGIGTGKVESKEYQVDEIVRFAARLELADKPNSTLSIDLNLRPSSLMVMPEGVEDAEPVDFPWHCEKGLAANIDKVKQEFCKINNLLPIKIFVNGPPLSGKSYFGDKLAEHYNIPHICLKTLIPELEACEPDEQPDNGVIAAMRNWKKANDKKRYPNELLCEMVRHRLLQND
jgi:adenylate kinase